MTNSSTIRTFVLSRSWKTVFYILLSILLLAFSVLAIGSFMDPILKAGIVFNLPFSIVMIVLVVCGYLQLDEKVILDNNSIRKESRLINRTILLEDIKGCRLDKNYLYIIPKKGKGKRILVSILVNDFSFLEHKWARHYRDLEVEDIENFVQDVKEKTGEPNMDKNLKRAKTEVYWLIGITVVLSIVSCVYTGFCQILLFCCVPLSLLLMLRHKGMVQSDTFDGNRLPSIAGIPVLVMIVLLLQSGGINLLDYGRVWQLSFCVAGALIVLLLLCSWHIKKTNIGFIVSALLLSLIFMGDGFAFVVSANYSLEKKNNYEYYESVVTEKHISEGKTRTYYITVQPWAHQHVSKKEVVASDVYHWVEVNDKVGIYYHKGAFNIPWYVVKSKR